MEQVTFSGETCCHSSSVQLKVLGSRPCNKKKKHTGAAVPPGQFETLLAPIAKCLVKIGIPIPPLGLQNAKTRTLNCQSSPVSLGCCAGGLLLSASLALDFDRTPLLAACDPLHTTDSGDFDIGLQRHCCHFFCGVRLRPFTYYQTRTSKARVWRSHLCLV